MLWVLKRTVSMRRFFYQDGSFEHPRHMFKLMNKKIIAILHSKILLNWPYDTLEHITEQALRVVTSLVNFLFNQGLHGL